MSSSWWTKTVGTIAVILLSVLILLVAFTPVDRNDRSSWPGWYTSLSGIIDAQITPGLDLQGGLHVQYKVNVESAIHDKLVNYAADLRRAIREAHPGVTVRVTAMDGAPSIVVETDSGDARALLDDDHLRDLSLIPVRETGLRVRLDLDSTYIETMRKDSVAQAIQTIERRVNDLGLTEPSIQARGSSDIIVQLPGVDESRIESLLALIETTALLEFRLLSPLDATFWVTGYQAPSVPGLITSEGYPFAEDLSVLREAMKLTTIPEGTAVGFEEVTAYDPVSRSQQPSGYRARLMDERVWLTGDAVASADPAVDPQFNRPIVSMTFDRVGASAMGQMTGENIGRAMTVVLDDIIVSIATIQGRIMDRGQITMGNSGNYDESYAEVERICMALRNGALVAPIEKQFETRIGPSLGRDAAKRGITALFAAYILAAICMFSRYRLSGGLAVVAMAVNTLFTLAVLAYFGATMTLPGIAGLTLSMGMAVDANVIIYERIREELRDGRSAATAIELGYDKAFTAIFDSNVTTLLTGVVLYQFGSGPVRGFALTLMIGILISMYTAIVMTKLVYDYLIVKRNIQTVSV